MSIPQTVGQIMLFRVKALQGSDTSVIPSQLVTVSQTRHVQNSPRVTARVRPDRRTRRADRARRVAWTRRIGA